MAVVISGFATASAIGLPLGTLLSLRVGWRGTFVVVVVLSVAVLALTALALRSLPPSAPPGRTGAPAGGALVRRALTPGVLATLAIGLAVFAGIQAALTYLVPFLRTVTGVSAQGVTLYLLAYGAATALASGAGGRFADGNAALALIVGALGVAGCLVMLALGGALPVVAALGVVGAGVFGMGLAPALQHRTIALAGPAGALAASFPASVMNAGIAAGSAIGGVAIGVVGLAAVPLVGAAAAALGALVAVLAARRAA